MHFSHHISNIKQPPGVCTETSSKPTLHHCTRSLNVTELIKCILCVISSNPMAGLRLMVLIRTCPQFIRFSNTPILHISYLLTFLSVNTLTDNLLYHLVGLKFQTSNHGNKDHKSQLELLLTARWLVSCVASINLF